LTAELLPLRRAEPQPIMWTSKLGACGTFVPRRGPLAGTDVPGDGGTLGSHDEQAWDTLVEAHCGAAARAGCPGFRRACVCASFVPIWRDSCKRYQEEGMQDIGAWRADPM